jgi:hypothetical protein
MNDQKADLDKPGSQCGAESHIPISGTYKELSPISTGRDGVDRRFNLRQHWETCGTLGLLFANAPSVAASIYTVIEGAAH